jgi:hypothetical protein
MNISELLWEKCRNGNPKPPLNKMTHFNYSTKIAKVVLLLFVLFYSYTSHSQNVIVIKGLTIDAVSKQPLPFCSIGISKKSIGTLSNDKGEFILKISENYRNDTLQVSSVGYNLFKVAIAQLDVNENLEVNLLPSTVDLKEVIVIEATKLVKNALKKIKVNYNKDPLIMEGFYRESVKLADKDIYFAYSEGILQMYKSPVNNLNDEVRMVKGRKKDLPYFIGNNPQKCIVPKITNGPNVGIILDFVKHQNSFLNLSSFPWYVFTFEEKTVITDKEVYVLSFNSHGGYTYYKGKVFIEKGSLAFVRAEYSLNEYGLETVNNSTKKNTETKLLERNYVVNYAQFGGRWSFHDANVVNIYEHNCQNKLLENKMSYVITKIEDQGVKRFMSKEVIALSESFSEQTMAFDEEFWKDFNIIKE